MSTPSDKSGSKKAKLVRDSFTIPKAEFAAIETLKARAIGLGRPMKKSELLRAGLKYLQQLSDAEFQAALAAVPTLKTGRPMGESAEASATEPAPSRAKKKAVNPPAESAPVAAAPVAAASTKPVKSRAAPRKPRKAPVNEAATSLPAQDAATA